MFRKYKEENHPAVEVKEEVALQLRLKNNLISTIPPSIVIGPFIVQINDLKMFLVNKRHEIASRQMSEFAIRMKLLLEQVIN